MTISEITMRKFIADIKKDNVPAELKDLIKKIKIEAIASNRPMITLTTIPVLRRLYTINEITLIINHYRHKPLAKQTKLEL